MDYPLLLMSRPPCQAVLDRSPIFSMLESASVQMSEVPNALLVNSLDGDSAVCVVSNTAVDGTIPAGGCERDRCGNSSQVVSPIGVCDFAPMSAPLSAASLLPVTCNF